MSGAHRLNCAVRDVMSPGVVAISADASLLEAHRAMVGHRVHAVLVLGPTNGTPLGWVTARGLLGWIERDLDLVSCAEAITEPAHMVAPSATAGEALSLLLGARVTHLLVCRAPGALPEGVVGEFDLSRLAAR